MKDPVIWCPSKQKSTNCSIMETSVEAETCSFCLYASCYKWRYLSHSTMFLWTEGNLGVYTPVFYCLWKYSKHGTCVKVDYCWAVYRFIGLLMPCALWTLHLQHASRLLLVHTYMKTIYCACIGLIYPTILFCDGILYCIMDAVIGVY